VVPKPGTIPRPGRVAPAMRFVTLFLAGLVVSIPSGSLPPPLVIEAPPQLEAEAASLEARSAARLAAAAELVGATGGSPVRVVLLPERSPAARKVSPKIAGFARTDLDLAVLLPERVPTYPDDDLAILLVHEVTHLMTSRAAGGGQLPRWFVEGVALMASRGWSLSDRSRVLIGGLRGAPGSTRDLEVMFRGSGAEFASAYALSGALVRHLMAEHGSGIVAAILRGVAKGASFETAFEAAAGEPLAVSERSFWRRVAIWYRWVPFLTSGATLWMGITALVLVAVARRRRRDAEIHRRWELEDRASEGVTEELDDLVN